MLKFNTQLFLLLVVAGCDATLSPSAKPNASSSSFSDEEGARIAVVAAKSVGQAVAAIVPIKDLQGIYENGRAWPRCPVMSAKFEGQNAALTLDYGAGCPPDAFAAARFGGRVKGVTQISYNGLRYELEGFSVGAAPLGGTIAGAFKTREMETEFTTSVILGSEDGAAVRGSATIVHHDSDGRLVISAARLTVGAADGSRYQLLITDATIDGAGAPSLVPRSGIVVFDIDNTEIGEHATRQMEFTAATPMDGTMISR